MNPNSLTSFPLPIIQMYGPWEKPFAQAFSVHRLVTLMMTHALAPCTLCCRACMIDKPGESGDTSAHILRASAIAAKYGGQKTARPVAVFGLARARQNHHRVGSGGVYADHGWTRSVDAVHGSDQRWAFRSHLSQIHAVGVFID